ncbi:MAG TPA: DUF3291 domain-containing protein [Pyrinomonadaceae bacterium]|nr:DUF3291 domain-containing protein [Pyrinomonadaceae bacterium]
METRTYHLAQLNVARLRAPLDSPLVAGFVSQLDAINAAAERAAGFVWRMKSDDAGASRLPVADPRIVVNISVWQTLEDLRAYVYQGEHLRPLRERAEWFEKWDDGPSLVLWWIARDTLPRVSQAFARLKYLRLHGATPRAFTFKEHFPPPTD